MKVKKDSAIDIASSIGGMHSSAIIGANNISKAADMQLARNLAIGWGPDNIRVNCIAPGLIKTDFAKALYEDPVLSAKYNNETSLRRMGEPDDIGRVFGQPCRAVRDGSNHRGRQRDDDPQTINLCIFVFNNKLYSSTFGGHHEKVCCCFAHTCCTGSADSLPEFTRGKETRT